MTISKLVPAIAWEGDVDGALSLIDQTRLPSAITELRVTSVSALVDAIRELRVRGAPAIGIAAAYGMVLAGRGAPESFAERAREALGLLAASRPTAVNLFHCLERQRTVLDSCQREGLAPRPTAERLLAEARAIHDEDAALCDAIGRHGAALFEDGMTVLTHCNTGRFATGGIGTALGMITTAAGAGKRLNVLANETRPLLQGARLTAFELLEAGIECALLPDSAGPGLMARGIVDAVCVGADRITASGDVANKVGTLPLALAARRFEVPFYVAAPTTTLDPDLASGDEIPIEQRDAAEILDRLGRDAPPGVTARNPAFDVTPADLVTALVTERGILRVPDRSGIKQLLSDDR